MKKLLNMRKSLFFRIWISVILTSIIPLLVVNGIWYNNTSNIVYKNEMQSASSLLYQLNMRMENVFNSININSYPFLFDSKVREILSVPPQNEEIRSKNEEYIQDIFRQMKKSNTMICSVEFVGKYYSISSEMTNQHVDFEKLKQYKWYAEFSDYYVEMVTPIYNNDYIEKFNTKVVGWIRKITPSDSMTAVGNFLIEISYSNIASVMKEAMEKSGNKIMVFDKRGNLFFKPDDIILSDTEIEELVQKVKTSEDVISIENHEKEYACLAERSAASGWYIVMMVEKEGLLTYIKASVRQSMLFGIFIVFFGFVIASVLSRNITKPVSQLAATMKQVEKDNLEVTAPVDQSVTEVAILSRGFNKMISHIRNLIEDIRREEREKKEMEIKMLQAQINPHFLYNTLNVIRWKAVMHGEETISKMIISLIKLLEFSGKKTDAFITIEKELEHAVSYLELIQYQYPDDFEVIYDIDQEALSCYTVKFILQPLLENAVFHGIEPLKGKGKVFLQIKRRENHIYFKIEDNGVGMSTEVQNNLSAFRGWGIFNVNERLKKHYGEEAILNIESEEGVGTKICFVIPAV